MQLQHPLCPQQKMRIYNLVKVLGRVATLLGIGQYWIVLGSTGIPNKVESKCMPVFQPSISLAGVLTASS